MDFVDGVCITEYTHGRSRAERIELFLRVCEAVGYAHEHGVVHLDLKPANILVLAGGDPRVLDFGIAKLVSPEASGSGDRASTLSHCFTMEYASPEQVRGEPAQASDVHGLGLVFYEILLGRRPFEVGSLPIYEAARVVCEQTPDLADLTPQLASIVGKSIRKDPAQRYANVREFATAIQDHLEAPGRQRLNRKIAGLHCRLPLTAVMKAWGPADASAAVAVRPNRRPTIYQLTSILGSSPGPFARRPIRRLQPPPSLMHGIWWRPEVWAAHSQTRMTAVRSGRQMEDRSPLRV
jgi:serine/threonine protein kinase